MGDFDTERMMDAWLDGELPPDKAAEVQERLKRDPHLRRQYGPLVELLSSPEPVDVPADLGDRIVAAVHERATTKTTTIHVARPTWARVPNRLAWAGAMAASIALFLAGWFGSRWSTKPTPGGGPAGPQPIQVVSSPWMLAAYAQSLTAHGPMYPTPFVVQGVTIEMLADGRLESDRQAAGVSAGVRPAREPRAAPDRPAPPQHRPEQPVPLFPVIQRL
jgi:hypothetical protein